MITIKNITGSALVVQYSADSESYDAGVEYDISTREATSTAKGIAILVAYILQGFLEVKANGQAVSSADAEKALLTSKEKTSSSLLLDERQLKTVTGAVINVLPSDLNNELIVESTEDYSIILPNLINVSYLDRFFFKNLTRDDITGTFIPAVSQTLEGANSFELFGRGILTLKKTYNSTDQTDIWTIETCSNLKSDIGEGKTKVHTFSSASSVEVQHDLGHIPSVEVWVEDGQGGYSEANVDVDHDLINKDNFTVNLGVVESGFVLYV